MSLRSFLGKARRKALRLALGKDFVNIGANLEEILKNQREIMSIIGEKPEKDRAESDKQAYIELSKRHLRDFENTKMVRSLNEKSVCVDLGANVGDVTEVFLSHGAEVYAFEPHPVVFSILANRFDGNPKAHLFNKAVGGKNGTMKLFRSQNDSFDAVHFSRSASLYASKSNVNTAHYDEIEVIDFADFVETNLAGGGVIADILKIDIEGAEYAVLEKLIANDLHTRFKHILVETHERMISEIKNQAARVRKLIADKKITNINLDWI